MGNASSTNKPTIKTSVYATYSISVSSKSSTYMITSSSDNAAISSTTSSFLTPTVYPSQSTLQSLQTSIAIESSSAVDLDSMTNQFSSSKSAFVNNSSSNAGSSSSVSSKSESENVYDTETITAGTTTTTTMILNSPSIIRSSSSFVNGGAISTGLPVEPAAKNGSQVVVIGAAAGGGVMLVLAVIVAVLVHKRKSSRNKNNNKTNSSLLKSYNLTEAAAIQARNKQLDLSQSQMDLTTANSSQWSLQQPNASQFNLLRNSPSRNALHRSASASLANLFGIGSSNNNGKGSNKKQLVDLPLHNKMGISSYKGENTSSLSLATPILPGETFMQNANTFMQNAQFGGIDRTTHIVSVPTGNTTVIPALSIQTNIHHVNGQTAIESAKDRTHFTLRHV